MKLTTTDGPLGKSFQDKEGKTVAVARKTRSGGWLVKILGHNWPVTPDMGVARFEQVHGFSIKDIHVKHFPTIKEARAAIQEVLNNAGQG